MDTLRIHDNVAQQRIKFSTRLNEMGDDLANLAKEMEKTRKQVRGSLLLYVLELIPDLPICSTRIRALGTSECFRTRTWRWKRFVQC
jgi:hypothetical protein